MSGDVREKFRNNVETIGSQYFVDPVEEDVGGETVQYWKTALGTMNYLSDGNMLLVGEPGTGKTTFANLVASVNSGLPFDLFANTQIQGHPDQTKQEMLSRAHIGKLANEGEEEVIWQNTVYMPQILIDEFNRMPEGKQSIVQEYIRTGTLSHLNDVFYREDGLPFAATANHADGGTYTITPPNLDRFDVSLEFTHGYGHHQSYVQEFSELIEDDLVEPELTQDILETLKDEDLSYEEKVSCVEDQRADLYDTCIEDGSVDIAPFSPEEKAAFQADVDALDKTGDAQEFLEFLYDEINVSADGNYKRRSDTVDRAHHDSDLAFSSTENGMSARRYRSIEEFAKMTAFYLGDDEVDIDHVEAVAPYCLAHAVEFTSDYRAGFETQTRLNGEREEMDLARRLVDEVKENYREMRSDLQLMQKIRDGADLSDDQQEAADRIFSGPDPDHPHYSVMREQALPAYRDRFGDPPQREQADDGYDEA